ncbi:AraC family transcriptional regulator [Gracilibacillus caseinilyticus]|uniref:AraC family transcriptional regulator n=1 Tax=Gracilibacillus caseinilyticus TaxID=2932256 RepID=A0ABY4F1Z6_9BACI|nr:AraC family transcriptional regulator [Gracilibacillus caseinilyticus]UOQ50087.1 AraC family transcriptional regulator [Gracilibacillus caseinilyticus]
MDEKKRFTFSVSENPLPLYIESIGYNPYELDFHRPEGYPYYHWLQTVDGEGTIELANQTFSLPKGKGILLTPYTPHSYYSNHDAKTHWKTYYITFTGAAIDAILNALDMNFSALYEETEDISFHQNMEKMIIKLENDQDPHHLSHEISADLYQFIMHLKKYGKMNDRLSVLQSFEKIKVIVEWLEQVYPQDIGLYEISEKAEVSSQHLNKMFHDTFGISPYSFLVQLRIREAKRIMITDRELSLKEIAKKVGFNGVSHFVSTFKKREGITPSTYRSLHQ